jgi:hypothetical protein
LKNQIASPPALSLYRASGRRQAGRALDASRILPAFIHDYQGIAAQWCIIDASRH